MKTLATILLLTFLLVIYISSAPSNNEVSNYKPANILILLADDLGYGFITEPRLNSNQ